MKDEERKIIEPQIDALKRLYEDCLLSSKQLENAYNKSDFRELLIIILFKRALKFFEAYIILIRNELSEPSMSLVRSIFEASLLIRWSLKDEKNVRKYFKEGLSSYNKVLENLVKKNYFKGEQQKL